MKQIYDRFDLINARKIAKYNQANLAAILGVSQQYVSAMESGHKPLTINAIRFIKEQNKRNLKGLPRTPRKNGKKVVKRLNRINNLQNKNLRTQKVSDFSRKEVEKMWWEKLNARCLACKRGCKQSIYTKIIVCPQYQKA